MQAVAGSVILLVSPQPWTNNIQHCTSSALIHLPDHTSPFRFGSIIPAWHETRYIAIGANTENYVMIKIFYRSGIFYARERGGGLTLPLFQSQSFEL